jgi:hypothetical protein
MYMQQVIWAGSAFMLLPNAVNDSTPKGVLFKSTDGITWTTVNLPQIATWVSMSYANGGLWVVNQRGVVIVSYDLGTTWYYVSDLSYTNSSYTVTTMAVSSNGGEMIVTGNSGTGRRVRLGQTAIYTVPAGRTSKVTFNYLKNTQAGLTMYSDTVPTFVAPTINTVAGTSVTGTPVYLGPGSQVLANVDMDYSFMAIEEY